MHGYKRIVYEQDNTDYQKGLQQKVKLATEVIEKKEEEKRKSLNNSQTGILKK